MSAYAPGRFPPAAPLLHALPAPQLPQRAPVPPPVPEVYANETIMQLLAERYELLPVRPLPGGNRKAVPPPAQPPLVQDARLQLPPVRVQNFSYDNAVSFLECS